MRTAVITTCVATATIIAACVQEPPPRTTPQLVYVDKAASPPKVILVEKPVVVEKRVVVEKSEPADSPCKGLSQGACRWRSTCSWTNAYTRADGKQVAGYCHITTRKAR
jgi:hypothetical protein